MEGWDVVSVISQDASARREFRGVYPSDRLNFSFGDGKAHAILINCSPSQSRGSHWVAIYKNPFGVLWFFDSFGLPPLVPSIKNSFIETR